MAPLIDVENTAVIALPDTIDGGVSGYTYSFIVTNTGNGPDRFSLDAAFTNLTAPLAAIWIDNNGNHRLDPATDARLDGLDESIRLAAGESIRLMVTARAAGDMRLTATSLNDDPASVVWHRGASADVSPDISGTRIAVQLVKSQTVDTGSAGRPGPAR
ncbi:MAG: hypothetical protein WDN06_05975 [Asticcacaulis sp.]